MEHIDLHNRIVQYFTKKRNDLTKPAPCYQSFEYKAGFFERLFGKQPGVMFDECPKIYLLSAYFVEADALSQTLIEERDGLEHIPYSLLLITPTEGCIEGEITDYLKGMTDRLTNDLPELAGFEATQDSGKFSVSTDSFDKEGKFGVIRFVDYGDNPSITELYVYPSLDSYNLHGPLRAVQIMFI